MSSVVVPEGFRVHSERGAKLLLPDTNEAFLNPVQEFNRDLSVASIKVWSEQMNELKRKRWEENSNKKGKNRAGKQPDAKRQKEAGKTSKDTFKHEEPSADASTNAEEVSEKPREFIPRTITILEPLSATGLRSIRFAQEIPLVKYVIANDISPAAIEIMKRNVKFNGLGPEQPPSDTGGLNAEASTPEVPPKPSLGKVRVNEGDACALLYSHRAEKTKVDVVDLDPYGTAGPFIDGAVQCVAEGGLLCVTCTDLAVLATANYPEKCYANYGGVPVKAEFCHEVALRLVLHTIATSAARYGKYIKPLLSLSIDFYVRIWVQVHSAPVEVKKLFSKTSTYYVCSGCQSFHGQALGKVVDKNSESGNKGNLLYRVNAGPSVSGSTCEDCGGTYHVAGPMWSGPIHDKEFTGRLLEHIEKEKDSYGTSDRMKGMVTLAHEELDTPFYFTPPKIASFFHCNSPSLEDVGSALLNAGYPISRSHAAPGSLKTTASRQVLYDVYREWIKKNPVKPENIKDGSPAKKLLSKEQRTEISFKRNPAVASLTNVKLVRYQQNPTSHWGPGSRAGVKKRKRDDEEQ